MYKNETDQGGKYFFIVNVQSARKALPIERVKIVSKKKMTPTLSPPEKHAQKLSSFHELMDCNCCF